ncbi:MAG: ribonuclease P protein component [Candidatus Doudnabacteria bacterium]|nr:ribonuclease P protein component [Candidatus Doudnabacteria bacterium]
MSKKLVFLKNDQDFANFKKSRKLVSVNFQFRWHLPKNQNIPRFGFIVPKKTVKTVADRNKIKRRVKSILAKHLEQIRPVDILFFPKLSALKISFQDLEKEVVGLFVKAGIYDANSSRNK